jgi:hypothetical protein
MIPVDNIIALARHNSAPYSDLISDKVYKDISKGYRDVNVIIGIRGRSSFLSTCIRYFKKAIEGSELKVNITIVEQDNSSHYMDTCKDLGIDYIFIPNSILKNGESYNRSFCFNVGYLLASPSIWYLFHDIDILINHDFFKSLKTYLVKNPKWLQTYTKKRVLLLNPGITEALVNSKETLDLVTINDYKEAQPGSTGGTLLVRHDIYMDVGGFDPEFFYGYGPEDSFFWSKLEVCNKPVDMMGTHFNGGGTFSDDPAIEVLHMYHEPMWYTNPHERYMLYIRESFWKYPYAEKLKIILEKQDILKKAYLLCSTR